MSFLPKCSDPVAQKVEFNRKAVALFSGGLDSVLAVHLIKRQGIDVTAVHFTSFFSLGDPEAEDSPVLVTSRQLDVPVVFIPRGPDFLDLLRNPRYGYGKNVNPCIDCRIHSLSKARQYMEQIGATFLITGEVVGQRPMSQRRHTLRLIEKQANCKGIVVRPLSAKVLPPTGPEEAGIIDRQDLLNVAGRGRKIQLALADELGLTGYSAPAGGCLLTDKNFSRRVRDLLKDSDNFSTRDFQILKIGRHYRIRPGLKVAVGRSESENDKLEAFCEGNILFFPDDFPGPLVLVFGRPTPDEIKLIGGLVRRHAKRVYWRENVRMNDPETGTQIVQSGDVPSEEWLAEHLI
jgi:tRNA-uridine 2-sulfurtransferase